MYFQHEYVREAVAMTLNGEYVLELPKSGLLSSLLLRISGAQASDAFLTSADWRIVDKISKIELIGDGATVIMSLTGYEAQALAVWDQGVFPQHDWRSYATNTQREHFLLNLGRWYKDTGFGLDLSAFKTVELKITNVATTSHFSDLTVSVLAAYVRDAGAGIFRGYMRKEEWRSWTTAQNETKYNSLPVDYLIRRIVVQAIPNIDGAEVEQTGLANLMEDIELSLDTGQVRVYKGGLDDLLRLNHLEAGKDWIVGGAAYFTADQGVDISLGHVYGGAWGAGSQDGAGAATIATFETSRNSFTQKPETFEADSPIGFLFQGIAPFLTGVFNFEIDYDPASWLDPRARYEAQLNIRTRDASASASGRNAIVLDRFVPYR